MVVRVIRETGLLLSHCTKAQGKIKPRWNHPCMLSSLNAWKGTKKLQLVNFQLVGW